MPAARPDAGRHAASRSPTTRARLDARRARYGDWEMPARLALVLAVVVGTGGCSLADRAYETLTVRAPTSGIDVNHASPDALTSLPGIEDVDADRIVQDRPYDTKSDLVRRGVVSEEQYAKFENRIYVGRAAPPAEPAGEPGRHAAPAPEPGD